MSDHRSRITEVRVQNMRVLQDVTLPIDKLVVLIGENGSGKSTLVEAFEILRRAADSARFEDELNQVHGGMAALMRPGARSVKIEARIEGQGLAPLRYTIELETASFGRGAQVASEEIRLDDEPTDAPESKRMTRGRDGVGVHDGAKMQKHGPHHGRSVLFDFQGEQYPDVARVREALAGIDVHMPFDALAQWARRERGIAVDSARDSITLAPTRRLDRFGVNLANVFQSLKNDLGVVEWERTLDLVRRGLGDWVEDVALRPDPAGSAIALALRRRGSGDPIPASTLSSGQLAFLCFVALVRIPSDRTLLVFDEPELHTHPKLLSEIISMLTADAAGPVVLATHSRRLLDRLEDPAQSVVLCDLVDDSRTTKLQAPDAAALDQWLARYDGLGAVLDDGFGHQVFQRSVGSRGAA